MVVDAWNSLISATIRNCFRKAGFPSHKDSEEGNEEVGMEDWRKPISNPVIKFSDFVNADEIGMTTATRAIKKLCQSMKSVNSQASGNSDV